MSCKCSSEKSSKTKEKSCDSVSKESSTASKKA